MGDYVTLDRAILCDPACDVNSSVVHSVAVSCDILSRWVKLFVCNAFFKHLKI